MIDDYTEHTQEQLDSEYCAEVRRLASASLESIEDKPVEGFTLSDRWRLITGEYRRREIELPICP